MSADLKNKMYMMEVQPPAVVWEKLSAHLDEINADNAISRKIYDISQDPSEGSWDNIEALLEPSTVFKVTNKITFLRFKQIAAAAVFVGIIITAWLLYQNSKSKNDTVVKNESINEKKNTTDLISTPADTNEANDIPGKTTVIAQNFKPAVSSLKKSNKTTIKNFDDLLNNPVAIETTTPVNNSPVENNFAEPIDDLSMVADGTNYVTMVNTSGRLVKIPTRLAHLAPRMQDKPLNEDYYEVLFGQGAYWQETLADWRKKLALAPIISGDNFSSFVELLKSVQGR